MKKYRTIYADPPWKEKGWNKGGKENPQLRGANRHYELMDTKQICDLPVSNIADENSHLYLWVTNNFLLDGIEVIKAWGFTYKTMITWSKITGFEQFGLPTIQMGLGQYFRGATEHCLFAVKGNLPYKIINGKRQQGITLIIESRTKHSKKPKQMREMIETVSYEPRIELFARQKTEGWDVWGNEVESDIEYPSLEGFIP